ncbi:MAG: undecaprenyl phosphate N,N'-diacetylbacillosamine 1-phosphate transferase [Campylobacter sp.]
MYKIFFKRFLDIIGAFFLLVATSPFMILTAILIYLKISREVIFRQQRPGLNGKIFTIYKFKTMSDERGSDGELLADEIRLGRFGKLIRSLSLDELPQLFNVLKGDMSFIGPRPLLVEYLPLYTPDQARRHDLRPGITGLAQVNGRNSITWAQKFEFDVEYVDNLSFALDVKIALMTIQKVLKRSGVSKDGMATTEKFNGHN